MQSSFAVKKYLHTVASSWIFINIDANDVDTDLPVATRNKTAKCATEKLQTNTDHDKNEGTQERKVQIMPLFSTYN